MSYDDGDYNVVDVPQTECPLSNNDFDELQALLTQYTSNNYGIELYELCLNFLSCKLAINL